MNKGALIYEGKGKKLFETEDSEVLIAEFKDDLTAFNAQKKGSEAGKGALNCIISEKLFTLLEAAGVKTHFVKRLSDNEMAVKRVGIIPIEVVVRNIATGSLVKRLALLEGMKLAFTLVEFYYKDDALGDPLINDEHAMLLNAVERREELDTLRELARKVNDVMVPFFDKVGLTLVDFKLEFGKDKDGNILLSDEISPDSCRLWDKATGEKLDKDRFRQNLGSVVDGYGKILNMMDAN